MSEGNAVLQDAEDSFKAQGLPAEFSRIKHAVGPSASAGLWLFSGFRLGAMYASSRSENVVRLHVPGQLFFAEDVDFRMEEIGMEAAVTSERWGGLTIGGHVAKTKAIPTAHTWDSIDATRRVS